MTALLRLSGRLSGVASPLLRGLPAAARTLATDAEWEAQRQFYTSIKVDVEGPVATIKLNRPEALNALNSKARGPRVGVCSSWQCTSGVAGG